MLRPFAYRPEGAYLGSSASTAVAGSCNYSAFQPTPWFAGTIGRYPPAYFIGKSKSKKITKEKVFDSLVHQPEDKAMPGKKKRNKLVTLYFP